MQKTNANRRLWPRGPPDTALFDLGIPAGRWPDRADFKGEEDRYVFQGVHMLMDASPMGSWPKGKQRNSRVVFIGRNLDSMNLQEGFESCKSE